MDHLREWLATWVRHGDDWIVWTVLGLKAATSLVGLLVAGRWACAKCGSAFKGREEHPAVARALAALPTAEASTSGPVDVLDAPGLLATMAHGELAALLLDGMAVHPLLEPRERRRIERAAQARLAECARQEKAARAAADRKAAIDAEARRQADREALARLLAESPASPPVPAPPAPPANPCPFRATWPSCQCESCQGGKGDPKGRAGARA